MLCGVSGSNGALGKAIVSDLLSREIPVLCMSRTYNETLPEKKGEVQQVNFDFLEINDYRFILSNLGLTHLIHTAWETRHGSYWNDPDNRTWQAKTRLLFDAFAETGGKHFTLVGTCAEYSWDRGVMIEYDTPEQPSTLYGECKRNSGQDLLKTSKSLDTNVAVARLFSPFSPDENPNRITSIAVKHFLSGETLVLNQGDVYRDIYSTRSAARCLVDISCANATGIINVGGGRPIHLGSFLRDEIGAYFKGATDIISWRENMPDTVDCPRVLIAKTSRLEMICKAASYDQEDVRQMANRFFL